MSDWTYSMIRPVGCPEDATDWHLWDDVAEYDPHEGRVVTSRFLDGAVREALLVRAQVVEEATRAAIIAELARLGYTVTPAGEAPTDSPERALLRRILRGTGCELFDHPTGRALTFYDEDLRDITDGEAALIEELWT